MIKYVKADESDYIKVGNKVYPRDASGYGYADVDYITRDAQQRYEKEQADAKEKARIAELQKKAEPLYNATLKATQEAGEPTIEALSSVLVPGSGKCSTLAGEIIRAAQRIQYRDWNDGDRFFSGYGLETCGGSAEFLMDYTTPEIERALIKIAKNDLSGDAYTNAIDSLVDNDIIPYVLGHKELFAIEPEDSREYNSGKVEELQPLYDFDFAISGYEPVITEAYNRGIIDDDDVRGRVEDELRWNCRSGEVNSWSNIDSIEICNLTEEDYDYFRENYERMLRDWESELLEEYPELDED